MHMGLLVISIMIDVISLKHERLVIYIEISIKCTWTSRHFYMHMNASSFLLNAHERLVIYIKWTTRHFMHMNVYTSSGRFY